MYKKYGNILYISHECMAVNGEALQLHAVDKNKSYFLLPVLGEFILGCYDWRDPCQVLQVTFAASGLLLCYSSIERRFWAIIIIRSIERRFWAIISVGLKYKATSTNDYPVISHVTLWVTGVV